jgi:hypothetical protein
LRWTNPKAHEPAHGLFVRIAELLHYDNAARLARKCGLEGGFPNPGDILSALHALPLKEFDELERWTPIVTPTAVTLAGETFRRNDWSVAVRRYCPECMIESSHHRAWWDLKVIARCPLHDLPLKQETPAGAQLQWRDTDFVRLAGELARGRQPTQARRSVPVSFEAYVLDRLGVLPRLEASWLDELSLADVTDVVRWTGKLVIGGWRRDTPGSDSPEFRDDHVIAAGYRVAQAGELSIVRLLTEIGRNSPEHVPSLQHSFGWIYPCLMAVNRRAGAAWMLGLVREAADSLGVSGLRYRYQVQNRHTFTVQDVAAITRLRRGAVLNLAQLAGIEPHKLGEKKRHRFDRPQLELMFSALGNSFGREHAARRVGLDQGSFDRLARKGIFGDRIRRCTNDNRQDRFTCAALDAFVQQIIDRCRPMPANARPSAKLVDLIKLTACPSDEVFDQILRHCIPLRTRWPKKRRRSSIAEVRVLLEDLPAELKVARRIRTGKRVRPAAKSVEVVCRARAAGMLGVSIAALDKLADLGALQRAARPNGKIWRGNLAVSSVADVAANALSIADLGRILGRPATSVLEEVRGAGLFDEPVCSLDADTLERFGLVSWTGALQLYEKDQWRFSRAGFWRNLDWHLHDSQSAFMRKRLLSCDQADFWTTSRKTPVRIGFGREHFLDFVCRISTRYDAHAYLQRETSMSTLCECWPSLEIDREGSGDFVLTFGASHETIDADTPEQIFSLIRTVLESFSVVTSSAIDQEQMLLLPLKSLKRL